MRSPHTCESPLVQRKVTKRGQGADPPVEICRFDSGFYASPAWLACNVAPQTLEDFSGAELILAEQQLSGRRLQLTDQTGAVAELRGRASLRATDFATVLRLAENGAGIALLPSLLTERAVQEGGLTAVVPEWTMRDFRLYALSVAGKAPTARLRLFRDFLKRRLGTRFV